MENRTFGKAPRQANNIVGSKVLTKTTASKRAGTSTAVTSIMVNMQIKTIFFKEIPTLAPREKLSYAPKLVKRLFSSVQLPDSRKTKTLCKKVAMSNKGSEYFRNCEGISNSFSFSTPATAVAKGNSSQSKIKICSGRGDWKSLEKGCDRKFSYEKRFCKKSVCEQFISSTEKGWGQQACHQFEESNQYIPHHHFKMEILQSLSDILKQGDFMCKLHLNYA